MKGKSSKKFRGGKVDPHQCDNTCLVLRIRPQNKFFNSDLELITPNDPMAGYWTNGNENHSQIRSQQGNYAEKEG
ncbi:MAG: hypothetical protein IPN79_20020 [Saprospiraceae bacterium]|nr:hypothetical protein [Saprospiraceae bacterium]